MTKEWIERRKKAYEDGSLPYSFGYKIRKYFIGRECPICGCKMGVYIKDDGDPIMTKNPMPSIQHNIPIAMGGKNEIGNISVICHQCNITLQDTPTGNLNNAEVRKVWEMINGRIGQ